MLKIFYARESVDQTNFIFEQIKTESLLLVPDQFTLEAEKDALSYMGVRGIMDVEVMSMSQLGFRILKEFGGGRGPRIGRYGRHMLLTKLIAEAEKKGALAMYGNVSSQPAFIEMLNDMISELKQYGVDPKQLEDIAEGEAGILQKKLQDICAIYREYEEKIQGRFTDAEDYIDLFLGKIAGADWIKGRDIWIYGFDYFAPKSMNIIGKLISVARVNVVLTCDYGGADEHIFAATQRVIKALCTCAQEAGNSYEIRQITGYQRQSPAAIAAIERELFSLQKSLICDDDAITLVQASNYYTEAETAAAYIISLVRDKGLKLGEILVICNDSEVRAPIIKRIFSEYGLPLFIDARRSILSNPAAAYVSALIRSVAGMKTENVLALLKTGLCHFVTADEVETLENYAIKYKIRGNLWDKPFVYGVTEYEEADFAALNDIRQRVSAFFQRFAQEFKKSRITADRLAALYFFLRDEAKLDEMIEEYAAAKEELGFFEAAQETVQIWNELVSMIEQLNELLGEEVLSLEMMAKIIESGLAAVDIGVIPPSADGLMLGNMQRTRAGNTRALVVLGANEGTLPANAAAKSLLSEDERLRLMGAGREIGKLDQLRTQEEQLAIYKSLSAAGEYLFMSFAASDIEGKEERPARIFKDMEALFPNIEVRKDIVSSKNPWAVIQTRGSTLRHLALAAREESAEPAWKQVSAWYRHHEPAKLALLKKGLFYARTKNRLDEDISRKFYESGMSVSPTRLERYSRCPFAHFVAYALKPEERRIFELSGRESGEIYHECLLALSMRLAKAENGVSWDNVTEQQLAEIIDALLAEHRDTYKEGILKAGKQEEYRARRMKEILISSANVLVQQARKGKIKEMYFEASFARNAAIPAIEIETKAGKVFVEGKIDRVDILEEDSVKIIDYKSGNEIFSTGEAKGGFSLQLMLYLQAALGIKREKRLEPAGIFYFQIKDADIAAEGIPLANISQKISQAIEKEFKLNGIVINTGNAVEQIAGEFSRWSDVVSGLQKVSQQNEEAGWKYTGSALMEKEEFAAFMTAFNEKLASTIENLLEGVIAVSPKRAGTRTSCDYCQYKSICRFDLSLPECKYEKIEKI